MLPASRVIGHKEYGNTPPGGYPGRKTDPTYDMNWRRARVAAFRPRTGSGPAPAPDAKKEIDMPLIVRNKDANNATHLILGDRNVAVRSESDITELTKKGVPVAYISGGLHAAILANTQGEGPEDPAG